MKTTDRTAVMVGLDIHRRFSKVTARNAEGKIAWRQRSSTRIGNGFGRAWRAGR